MAEDHSASSTAQIYIWVKSLYVCTLLAFLPPRTTPTHPTEAQIFSGLQKLSSPHLRS